MKNVLLFITIFLLAYLSTEAQVRRIVLLEEATNASCPSCAQADPFLQQFFSNNFGGVISVRYHAWWPGFDPMYNLNTPDNTARINYYGISGVPNYMIDGENFGVPGSPQSMSSQMFKRLEKDSPVKIIIDKNIDRDSVRTNIKVIGVGTVNETQLYLRTAIIERLVRYTTPPGTNGQKDFEDVIRKLLPNSNGYSISSIAPGDTLSFYFSTPFNVAWNLEDLAIVCWLQTDATKEVIQSNISLPTYIIETNESMSDFVELNHSYEKQLYIYNENPVSLNVRLKLKANSLPADWSSKIYYNSTQYDSIDIIIQPQDTLKFSMQINTGNIIGTGVFSLFAQNLNDSYNYGFSINYNAVVKNGNILLVDADGGTNGHNSYITSLSNSNREFTLIDQSIVLPLLDQIFNLGFTTVIWANGWAFPAFISSEIDFLTAFMNNGGNLLIAGQDIGWDIFDPGGSSGFQKARDFYHNYLDAEYVSDDAGIASAMGIIGTLGEGLSFSIGTIGGYRYPEVIKSFQGKSDSVFVYTNTTKVGALEYDEGTFKSFYLGIGLEQVTSAAIRDSIVLRVLNWFGEPVTGIDDQIQEIPNNYYLEQNFPNPFNPTTVIRYSVPSPGKVVLRVFDILGTEISTLVSDFKQAGHYNIDFNASNLSSGIYFYSIQTSDFTMTKKMIYIK